MRSAYQFFKFTLKEKFGGPKFQVSFFKLWKHTQAAVCCFWDLGLFHPRIKLLCPFVAICIREL